MTSTGAALSGVRVLIVDDTQDSRELACFLLEREGAVVECAGSGEEALEKVKARPPDVLISDISMPGMDGFKLLSRVRALADVPAIALTAHASSDTRVDCLRAGFNDVLPKPLDQELMVVTVRMLVKT